MSKLERENQVYEDEITRERARKDFRSNQEIGIFGVIGTIGLIYTFIKTQDLVLTGIIGIAVIILFFILKRVLIISFWKVVETQQIRHKHQKKLERDQRAQQEQIRIQVQNRKWEIEQEKQKMKMVKQEQIREEYKKKIILDQKKILVVDDNNGYRVLFFEVFTNDQYIPYMAKDGVEAIQLVKEFEPDLVLMDIKMPRMDGIKALEKIKSINPRIHVIMMTAYGEIDEIQKCLDLGAASHFTKPVDIDEVREAVFLTLYPEAKIALEMA
ncbi:response regulator [Paenibacillus oryzisoli]|uniref:response regulator n=1 Tax=Paenibacillus oryzisoli TaxID=1850517 RepID=UPI003D2808A8